jgi:hypothetical protein
VWIAKPAGDRALTEMASAASATLAISLGILATTGLWDQHNQVLYVPATLVAICLSPFLNAVFYQGRGVVGLALVVCVALLFGGIKNPKHYPFDVANQISRLGSLSPAAQRVLAVGVSGSYARLGGNNDDQGHAFGLENWTLVCPRFHQYPFESEQILDKVLACASSAPTLVVAEDLASSEGSPIWNRFVRNVEDLLSSSYSCDAKTGLRICRRIAQ